MTTAINLIPLALVLLGQGIRSPNLAMAIAITLVGVVATPVIGTVIMTSMRQRRKLAAVVAELAASRAESARLSREAGAAAERERLAREIHDTLAQGFTSIVALAQAVEPELETDTAAAKRHVELIRTTARENLAEARAMVAELTPTALHESHCHLPSNANATGFPPRPDRRHHARGQRATVAWHGHRRGVVALRARSVRQHP